MGDEGKNSQTYREQPKPVAYLVRQDSTVEEFFDRFMSGKSNTARKQMLSKGVVFVGDRVLKRMDDVIVAGTVVTIKPKPVPTFEMPDSLKIVYEDDWLIVVNKAAGLLTIATETEKVHTAYSYLSDYLKFYHKYDRIFIVHRIDRGTSGLLVFAKSESVQRAMRDNWNETVISRRYVAVVEGRMRYEAGTVDTWINEDPKTLRMYVSRRGTGKRAVTHYRLLDETADYSLLELELETGRKNQIRVHMRHIGHVLAGDSKYGAQTDPIGRLCLHAMQIEFRHPVTDKVMNFETRIPIDFLRIFRREGVRGE